MKAVQTLLDEKDFVKLEKKAKEDGRSIASYLRKVILELLKPAK